MNNMQIERQGLSTEPLTHRYPEVRGGVCEFCGVLDANVDSKDQYKLCPHYRGTQLSCSYCPPGKNPDEVVRRSAMNVYQSPTNPNTVIVVCDSYECVKRHRERFQVNS